MNRRSERDVKLVMPEKYRSPRNHTYDRPPLQRQPVGPRLLVVLAQDRRRARFKTHTSALSPAQMIEANGAEARRNRPTNLSMKCPLSGVKRTSQNC